MPAPTIRTKLCARCASPLAAAQGPEETTLVCQACRGLFLGAQTMGRLTPERAAEP